MAVSALIKEAPGNAAVRAGLSKLFPAVKRNLTKVINKTLIQILRDSKTVPPRVPLDTGALQSTGRTEPAKIEGNQIKGSVMYGGFAGPPYSQFVDYAVLVHEDVSGRQYHRPGSGPKFIEAHFNRHLPEINNAVRQAFLDSARESE
jgi:hypothetical protein